ncbi:hypothetical protein MASR1M68_00260 [Elusimicrobiota bacterium]
MLYSLFKLTGILGLVFCILAFVFIQFKNIKMHKFFAITAFIFVLLHAIIYFIWIQ